LQPQINQEVTTKSIYYKYIPSGQHYGIPSIERNCRYNFSHCEEFLMACEAGEKCQQNGERQGQFKVQEMATNGILRITQSGFESSQGVKRSQR
jgi:hypothetical protein